MINYVLNEYWRNRIKISMHTFFIEIFKSYEITALLIQSQFVQMRTFDPDLFLNYFKIDQKWYLIRDYHLNQSPVKYNNKFLNQQLLLYLSHWIGQFGCTYIREGIIFDPVQNLEEVVTWRICIPFHFCSTYISLRNNDHVTSNCSKKRSWIKFEQFESGSKAFFRTVKSHVIINFRFLLDGQLRKPNRTLLIVQFGSLIM